MRTVKLQPELKSRGVPSGPSHVTSGFGNSDPLLYSITAVPPPILTVAAQPPRRFCHFLSGPRPQLAPVSPKLTVTAPPPRRFCHFLPGPRPRPVPVSPKQHPRTRPHSPAAGSRSPSRPRRRRSRGRRRSPCRQQQQRRRLRWRPYRPLDAAPRPLLSL